MTELTGQIATLSAANQFLFNIVADKGYWPPKGHGRRGSNALTQPCYRSRVRGAGNAREVQLPMPSKPLGVCRATAPPL